MSDAAVKTRTGRPWAAWFEYLDEAEAATLDHQAIVALVSRTGSAPSWWRQMIAVEYERARGLRRRHETASGFSVSISKTMKANLPALYAATARAAARQRWFPKGALTVSSQTKDKYFRGSWKKAARVEIGLYSKGERRSQIAVQISKLEKKADVDHERAAWKAALSRLQKILET
jgi:hypothetical protein